MLAKIKMLIQIIEVKILIIIPGKFITTGKRSSSAQLTLIAEFPGCLFVLKVAVNDVFTQEKLSTEFTVTFCPRVDMFSSSGQSGQYTPSQQNW